MNFFGYFQMTHKCSECGKVFTRRNNRDKNLKKQHLEEKPKYESNYECPSCEAEFKDRDSLVRHFDSFHLPSFKYKLRSEVFNGRYNFYSRNLVTLQPLESFVRDQKNIREILKTIFHQLMKFQVVKVSIIVNADYRIPSLTQEGQNDDKQLLAEERDNFSLRTKREIFNTYESRKSARKRLRNLLESLVEREQDLLMRGSGWQFEALTSCDIEIDSPNSI